MAGITAIKRKGNQKEFVNVPLKWRHGCFYIKKDLLLIKELQAKVLIQGRPDTKEYGAMIVQVIANARF